MIRTDVGLDPAKSPKHRAMTARVVAAWEAARARKDAPSAGGSSAAPQGPVHGDLPKPLPKSEHFRVLRPFGAAHHKLTDKSAPSPAYFEAKVEMVETGEVKAELLKEAANKEEASDSVSQKCTISSDGTLKFARVKADRTPPSNPEELRRKLKLMGVCWELLRLIFPTRPMFEGLTLELWSD